MWVTQTYLGEVEPNAQLYVYYVFEDYNREQKEFTSRVQRELEELGETYGHAVSLLFPNERYTARIGAETRSIQDFWWTLQGKLPGLLISSKPLSKFDPKEGEYYLVQFPGDDPKAAAQAVLRLRRITNEQLAYQFANQPQKTDESFWQRLLAAIEVKPGFGPVKLDLKKLAKRA
jgi:hypothetical protein